MGHVAHVLGLNESGRTPFTDRYYRDMTLAALIPNAAGEASYGELAGDPLVWWEPIEFRHEVERWLPVAAGNSTCVDHLVRFLGAPSPEDQARTGSTCHSSSP